MIVYKLFHFMFKTDQTLRFFLYYRLNFNSHYYWIKLKYSKPHPTYVHLHATGMSKHWYPPKNEVEEKLGGEAFAKLSIDSKVISTKPKKGALPFEPLVTPIFHSSVYKIDSVQHYNNILEKGGYIYQRLGNPTVETGELVLRELEGGAGTLLYNSGLAAVSDVLTTFLKAGDHMIVQNPVYSGSMQFIQKILTKFGVEVTLVHAGSPMKCYTKAIKDNTRVQMIYCETPCNPLMTLTDLEELGKLSSEKLLTVVDGTFASPYLQQSLKYGVDISIHSCSKYIGGHTDLIGGCVTVRNVQHWKDLKVMQSMTGSALSPLDASLLNRGLKTLPLRMKQHSENGLKVARFLELQPQIKTVYYPGLESHNQHELAKKQMHGFGGMISFEMHDLQRAKTLVEGVKLINLAVSLGGTESLIEHPPSMTHGPMFYTQEDRLALGITDGLVRFSVGLENADDLISDLKQALATI